MAVTDDSSGPHGRATVQADMSEPTAAAEAPPAVAVPERATTSSRDAGDPIRAALLAAAHDLLAAEGPGGLTVRAIAASAGMSTMNVYSRFGGKDGVLNELFIDGFRRLGQSMHSAPTTDDPLADLQACGAAYRGFARENPTYYSLMFDRAVPDFVPSDAAKGEALQGLARVVERVQRAVDAGQIVGRDPFEVATGLWACEHGLVSLEMRMSDTHGHFDWDRVVPATVDALVRGFTARGDSTA